MSLSIDNLELYPQRNWGVVKYTAEYLNKDKKLITYADVYKFRSDLEFLLDTEKLTPYEIKIKLNLSSNNFSEFLAGSMDLKRTTHHKNANTKRLIRTGKMITDEKKLYWKACSFNFDPKRYAQVLGYELLSQFGMYNSRNNKSGIHRDHMVSKEYGWRNKIDPEIISHPANCEFLLAYDNIKKNSGCSITLETLLERINNWDNGDLSNIEKISATRLKRTVIISDYQKQRIIETNKNSITYTNGISNLRQHKDLPPPNGFWPGMTRKKSTKIRKKPVYSEQQKKDFSEKMSSVTRDQKYFTNGIKNIRQHKDLPPPNGFWLGRTDK